MIVWYSESQTTILSAKDYVGTLYEDICEKIVRTIFECTQLHNYMNDSVQSVNAAKKWRQECIQKITERNTLEVTSHVKQKI